ncbi:MAG: hypothetical protein ACREDP_20495 [Bradyrhizobium sp.]
MTKQVNADSILRGNFCDIVNFFRGRDIDDVDRLAQRALTIILRTNHLVQTGDEVDTDPFCANMFASSALEAISATLKTYPFVRASKHGPDEDEEACFASAEQLIEMAEDLSPDPAMLRLIDDAVGAFQQMFGDPPMSGTSGGLSESFDLSQMEHAGCGCEGDHEHAGLITAEDYPHRYDNAYFDGERVRGHNLSELGRSLLVDADVVDAQDARVRIWNGSTDIPTVSERISQEDFEAAYRISRATRSLLVLTDGFKNDEAGYARVMAAMPPWSPPED